MADTEVSPEEVVQMKLEDIHSLQKKNGKDVVEVEDSDQRYGS